MSRLLLSGLALTLCGFDWGGRLGRLRSDLSNPDTEVRASAVRELRAHPAGDVADLVLAALEDVELRVRLDAALTAGRLRLEPAVPILSTWLESDDDEVRAVAAEALGLLDASRGPESRMHPEIGVALVRSLSDPRASVRSAAIAALALRHRDPGAASAVVRALDDPDGSVRAAAAQALSELGSEALEDGRAPGANIVVALSSHASDEASEVRVAIAASLGALGDARGATALRRLLGDPLAEVRLVAALGLGRLRIDDAATELAALSRATSSGEEREVAQAAVAALGRLRGEASFLALADAGASASSEIASTATAALEERLRLEPEPTRALLVATLQSPEAPRATWVVAMLARGAVRGLPDAAAPIAGLAAGGRAAPEVALLALGHAGGDAALRYLLVALEDAQREGTSLDGALLGLTAYFDLEGPDGRATEPLLAALQRSLSEDEGRDEETDRARLVTLLGRTASSRSASVLLRVLATDGDPRVLRESLVALSLLDLSLLDGDQLRALGVEAIPEIERALRHRVAQVRMAAARALGALGDRPALDRALIDLTDEPRLDRGAILSGVAHLCRRLALTEDDARRIAHTLGQRLLDEDPTLADLALDALASWGSAAALDEILGALDHADASRIPTLLSALGRFADPRAHARLESEVRARLAPESREIEALRAAVLVLGEHGTAADAQLLFTHWEHLSWPASAAASFSLARLARRGELSSTEAPLFVPLFCALGASHDPIVRANVAVSLAALGGTCDAISPERWMERPHAPVVRAAAARWLTAIDPDAERGMARCLDDLPPPSVHAACSAPALRGLLDTPLEITASAGGALARDREVALVLGDGSIALARTDANAHFALPHAPEGALWLEEPSSLPLEP